MIDHKRRLWCPVLVLLLILPSFVLGKDMVMLLSNDAEAYRKVGQGITATLTADKPSFAITTLSLDELEKQPALLAEKPALVVTVGTRATHYAVQNNISDAIYASFITASALTSEVTTDLNLATNLQGAVILDQPVGRVVELAKLIKPELKTLGTVVNSEGPGRVSELTEQVSELGVDIQLASLEEESNPISGLKEVFTNCDVFMVLPDKARFNSKIAKWVLYLSYRQRIPVIGYSQKYSEAGALVSIYSTPQQVGEDTGKRLVDYLEGLNSGKRPVRFHYPRYFKLSINNKVASSLNIKIESETRLEEMLRQQYGVRVRDEAGLTLEIVK